MSEMQQRPPEEQRDSVGWVLAGIGLGLGLHLIQFLLFLVVPGTLFFIGLSQLIYMVPAILIANSKRHKGMAKGLIILAALTFLLNAACYGFFFWMMAQWH